MEKFPFGICFAETDLPFENFNEMKWQNLASEWSKIRYFWQMQRVSYEEEEKRIYVKLIQGIISKDEKISGNL